MKVCIFGSREVTPSMTILDGAMTELLARYATWMETRRFRGVSLIISGGARGVDRAGEKWARQRGLPLLQMNADWEQHGKAAGVIRNTEMAKECDAAIGVWDGRSKGTADMIAKLEALHRPLIRIQLGLNRSKRATGART